MAEDPSSEAPQEEELPPPIPTGLELTALDEDFRDSPYAVLEEMRSRDPVHHDAVHDRYFLTRHDDVAAVLRDHDRWSDLRKAGPDSLGRSHLGLDADREPSTLFVNDADHARLRGLVSTVLNQNTVDAFRPRIHEIVTKLLDELEETEFEFDAISRYARPIPTLVISELLGVDPAQRRQFKRWSDTFNAAFFAEARSADGSGDELSAFFRGEVAARRSAPGKDLISALLRGEPGASLGDGEIVQLCKALLVAGTVATTDLIGNGIRAMLQSPRQMTKLRDRPDLIGNAVEEILRFDSPIVGTLRVADADTVIGGCPVARGETLSLSLASANHDDAVYSTPERFDIERADTHHQSFGGGRHFCLGAALARAEAEEAILGLVVRFPEMELSARGWEFASARGLRSMKHFWIST